MPSVETRSGKPHQRSVSKTRTDSSLTSGARTTLSFERSMSLSSSLSFDGPIVGPLGSSGKVLLDDDELLRRAQETQRQVDFEQLTDLSKCHWKWKDSKNDFTLFTRELEAGDAAPVVTTTSYQVLAAGEIQCSIEELAHILRSPSEVEYNAVMSGLYKKDFIYGSIVHVASSVAAKPVAAASEDETSNSLPAEQLTVKTSAFVRSNIFMRNEQWCYLEHFQRAANKDAFTLTMTSLLDSDITAGKVKSRSGRVDQLHDLVAGYSVERIPASKSVRVLFHSNFSGNNAGRKGNASVSMTKSRIVALAKGVSQLPEVVRRRRLGVQKLADRTAFAAKNARCICCTKSLHLLSKKKRCYLCGYFVCDKDWSIQKMETRHGHVTTIRVCARCIESVDNCEFAEVSPKNMGKLSVQPDSPTASKAGTALATFLQDALRNSNELKKESVKTVIKHLVNEERRLSEDNTVALMELNEASDEKEYITALDKYFHVQPIALQDCVLANNEKRAYALEPPEDAKTMVSDFPIPDNEAQRISTIDKGKLLDIRNADELNIICTLAARELDCMMGLVTIVGPDSQMILASNLEPFRLLSLPRNQTFCQHAVMDTKPLFVPHPEADVRFAHIGPLKQNNLKFYCGFPITDRANAVVGTVCCFDTKSHDLTQAQYATMLRLAETASKIVRLKGQEAAQ